MYVRGIIKEDDYNNVVFNLQADINRVGGGVKGQGLWKVGVWLSYRCDGKGERYNYLEQVQEFA